MARTITAIKEDIITRILANSTLSAALNLDTSKSASEQSYSATAVWYLLIVIFANAAYVVETLFVQHKSDVNATVTALKPHSISWYRNKALAYLHGFSLLEDSDEFDTSEATDEEIEEAQIIAVCAVIEDTNQLTLKIAREVDSEFQAVTAAQKSGFEAYMEVIKDAGVRLNIVSRSADILKLEYDVYYDPLILDSSGQRLDGTDNTPVQDAVTAHLKELDFNGQIVLAHLTDALQEVEGVVIPHLKVAESKQSGESFEGISVRTTPFAGYFSTVEGETDYLTLNFTAYA